MTGEPGTDGRRAVVVRAVTGAGLVVVVAALVADRVGFDGRPPDLTTGGWCWAGAVVLVAAGALGFARGRGPRITAACGAAVASVVLGAVVAGSVRDGLPGPPAGALAVGAAAVLAGCVIGGLPRRVVDLGTGPGDDSAVDHGNGTAGTRRPPAGRATRAVLVAVVSIAVVGAAAAAAAGVGPAAVHGDTALGPTATDAAVVLRPGAVRWRWESPTRVADVAAVAGGVVVRRTTAEGGNELVALDGTTGTPRWTYRRGSAEVDSLAVSPDGRSIVLAYLLPDHRPAGAARLLAVVDAVTGTERWTAVLPTWPSSEGGGVLQLTDRVVTGLDVVADGEIRSYRIVAHALDSGRVAWTWTPPPGCRIRYDGVVAVVVRQPQPLRTRDVVAAWQDCGRDRIGTGIDDRTGAVRWTLPPLPFLDADGDLVLEDPVVATVPDAGRLIWRAARDVRLVDPETGRILARPSGTTPAAVMPVRSGPARALFLSQGDPPDGIVIGSLDPATGQVLAVPTPPPRACATSDGAITVTAEATLRLCGVGAEFGLRVDAPGEPQTFLPVDPGPTVLRPEFRPEPSYVRDQADYMIVPAPGALVVGVAHTEPSVLVGFGPG